jgi:hypothetical protein
MIGRQVRRARAVCALVIPAAILAVGCTAAGSSPAGTSTVMSTKQLDQLVCSNWQAMGSDRKRSLAQELNDEVIRVWNLGIDSGVNNGQPRGTPQVLSASQVGSVVAVTNSLCAPDDHAALLVVASLGEQASVGDIQLPGFPRR